MGSAVSWLHAEPLADVIYRKLSQNIGDGIYEPGTRLVQNQVAEDSASRIPRCAKPCSGWLRTVTPLPL